MARTKEQTAVADGPSTVDSIATAIEESERQEAAEKQQATEAAYLEYAQVLQRDAAGQLKPADAKQIDRLIRQLGLAADVVRSDRAIVETVLKQLDWHEKKPACAERVRAAREAKVATRKRCEKEIEQAEKAQSQAEGDYYAADQAAYELGKLARTRPELFDNSTPPRLRA